MSQRFLSYSMMIALSISASTMASTLPHTTSTEALTQSVAAYYPRVAQQQSLLVQMLLQNNGMAIWEDYARARLAPDFFRDYYPLREPLDYTTYVTMQEEALIPEFVAHWQFDSQSALRISGSRERLHVTPLAKQSLTLLGESGSYLPGNDLSQSIFSTSYATWLDDRTSLGVTAVIAYQEFANAGLGRFEHQRTSMVPYLTEKSTGNGLKLGITRSLREGLQLTASFQSKIDMDEFQRYKGLYGDPGDFDIPATASIGLSVQPAPSTRLVFNVERVMYSDIGAFNSGLLPDRFESLLGDSTSPEFAWQDLTIYRVGWQFSASETWDWSVDYSTRNQPLPTSSLLELALERQLADHNYSVGVRKQISQSASFHLNAHYASNYLYIPNRDYSASTSLSDKVELEALWSIEF